MCRVNPALGAGDGFAHKQYHRLAMLRAKAIDSLKQCDAELRPFTTAVQNQQPSPKRWNLGLSLNTGVITPNRGLTLRSPGGVDRNSGWWFPANGRLYPARGRSLPNSAQISRTSPAIVAVSEALALFSLLLKGLSYSLIYSAAHRRQHFTQFDCTHAQPLTMLCVASLLKIDQHATRRHVSVL
jgi:hypothetical protein